MAKVDFPLELKWLIAEFRSEKCSTRTNMKVKMSQLRALRFRFLRVQACVCLGAIVLAIAPAALLYVGVAGSEQSKALTRKEAASMELYANILERPGRLLMPRWKYPTFWHSHLAPAHFWHEVGAYFGINFLGWWLVIMTIVLLVESGKMLLIRKRRKSSIGAHITKT